MKCPKIILCSLLLSIYCLFVADAKAQVTLSRAVTLMGSRFDITLVAPDTLSARNSTDAVIAEIARIENLISEWKPESQVSEINRNAGIRAVKVDRELFELTKRSLYFSAIADGAFDISFAAMDKVWRFDGSMKQMPSPEEVKKSVEKVGYKNIELDSTACTVFLKLKGMKIGFGAMGKGYAADKGRELMEKSGIKAGIVNASGDMATWGTPTHKRAWRVGITNPFEQEKEITILTMQRGAVVTSGSYEKYVEFDGKRYTHIIDPKTGYPATGLISVTVTGPDAAGANGFSTAIMVLGAKKGLELLQKYPQYQCLMVTDAGKVIKSAGFKYKIKQAQ